MVDSPPAHVQFANEFKVELRTLAKRYRQIRADIQPLIEQLQVGELPGDQISGTGYTVFKVRVKNSDVRKGKSAGYRIIYQSLSPTSVLLLLIYAKSDRTQYCSVSRSSDDDRPLNPPILGDFEQSSSPKIGGWGA